MDPPSVGPSSSAEQSEAALAAEALAAVTEDFSSLTTSTICAEAAGLEPLRPEELLKLAEPLATSEEIGTSATASAAFAAAAGRLATHPYDLEAWAVLVEESKTTKWRRREVLAAACRAFPTSGKCWVDLVG